MRELVHRRRGSCPDKATALLCSIRIWACLTTARTTMALVAPFAPRDRTPLALMEPRRRHHNHPKKLFRSLTAASSDNEDSGQVGQGPNWIERSFPVTTDEKIDPKRVDDYNLRVSGASFGTGPLSKRMYDAILSKSSLKIANPDILRAWKLYAMDFTAKEAVRAALQENGLELTLTDDEQDQGMWGDVDSIQLLSDEDRAPTGPIYDSWDEVIDEWEPGVGFDFIVRQVPAKMAELSVDELLAALDPDGSLRKEAKEDTGERSDVDDEDEAV